MKGAYATPSSSVAGAGLATGSATPQRCWAPVLRRRLLTNSVDPRDANFGRGPLPLPPWATMSPPTAFPTALNAWSGLVFAGLRWSVVFWPQRA